MADVIASDARSVPVGGAVPGDLEVRVKRLLATVGERVRSARKRAGLSRRALSETSGVSQRYIAQLESGKGNISIGLLMRLGDALDLRIDRLVAPDDPWHSPAGAVATRLPMASAEQLERIMAILEPGQLEAGRARRIAFIGLRGAGKSTLGRMTADRLGLPFLELNEEIERASGMAVNEVIALYGQEGYRHLERGALERIAAAHEALVLAVAGGIVSDSGSFDFLLGNYHTIWLKAEPEEHMARVRAQGDERPMAGYPDAMEDLRRILTDREALYARAAVSINTSGRTPVDSLGDVLGVIEREGFLRG